MYLSSYLFFYCIYIYIYVYIYIDIQYIYIYRYIHIYIYIYVAFLYIWYMHTNLSSWACQACLPGLILSELRMLKWEARRFRETLALFVASNVNSIICDWAGGTMEIFGRMSHITGKYGAFLGKICGKYTLERNLWENWISYIYIYVIGFIWDSDSMGWYGWVWDSIWLVWGMNFIFR